MAAISGVNKFDLMHVILGSTLKPENKVLLITMVLLHNEKFGAAWPSVERLCQARSMSHEKNFLGVEHYLPGLVKVTKRGRRGNHYVVDVPAVMALPQHVVTLKHTAPPSSIEKQIVPAQAEEVPSVADLVPDATEDDPSSEGANSTRDTTRDSSRERTREDSTSKGGEDGIGPSTSPLADNSPPRAAKSPVDESPPLGEETPAPGDRAKRPEEGPEALELIGVPRNQPSCPEDVTEAYRAARGRVLLIEREVEKRVRSDERRREVLTRALALDAAGFSGRLDALIDEALWDGDPW